MRTLEPANRKRIGLMGLIVTVMVVGVGQTLTSTPQLFAEPTFFGQFTDSGQLNKGDKVRIAGVDVGDVEAIKIDGDHVVMKFSTGSQTIGTESRLAIKTPSILGDRSQQVDRLFVNANSLLAAFNERSRAISALLSNVATFSAQVQNLINDNPNLNHVLEQLHIVSDLLDKRKDDLALTVKNFGKSVTGLNEAVASGPYFKVQLTNLLPYWILQPWVDAAFKKRGIDPENFWRSAGLPAFRFPDPNGTRFPNGAPPPSPPTLEGTPDHPYPAVAPGSPCSYTPMPELFPRPGNPMPCAGIDQNLGPFGPNGPYPALPNVASSPPNPAGLPPTPGIPIAGRPGEVQPDVPGTPVPIAPGPYGGRTEPLGPLPRPAPANPAAAPPPGPIPPGPPPPPGPGNNLPAPYIGNTGGAGGSGAQGGNQN